MSSSELSTTSIPGPPTPDANEQVASRLPKFLLKEAIVAPEGYNRYRSALPALATNICGGSVYAWSIFNNPLTRELGVVASCSADWTLTDVVPVFSVNAACLGACTFATGKWLEVVGPRAAGAVAATCFSSGLVIGGIGVMYHTLPLVYLGYGFLGGCGAGLSYVSPVSNMSRWFPDKRGLATGAAVMGFGGGAMVAAPLDSYLLSVYSKPPTRLGSIEDLRVVTEGGVRMADTGGGQMGEVVVATSADVAGTALEAGVYVVGTGDTGVAATFVTVGLLYGGIMAAAASQHRVAPEGYIPPGYTPPQEEVEAAKKFVHIDDSLKTPQFWMLWIDRSVGRFSAPPRTEAVQRHGQRLRADCRRRCRCCLALLLLSEVLGLLEGRARMGGVFAKALGRLVGKQEMRILMVRGASNDVLSSRLARGGCCCCCCCFVLACAATHLSLSPRLPLCFSLSPLPRCVSLLVAEGWAVRRALRRS
jgi:hypothetical protein